MEEFGSGHSDPVLASWPSPWLLGREDRWKWLRWEREQERCGDRCGLSPNGEQTWSLRSSASGGVLEDGILRTSRLQSKSLKQEFVNIAFSFSPGFQLSNSKL